MLEMLQRLINLEYYYMHSVTVNDITYTFTEWEEIDEIYIHIFTTEGTTVCIPKDLLDGTI